MADYSTFPGTIKILIVDDSAIVRQALTKIFSQDPHFKVIATAQDPLFAISKIQKEKPDVITLDIEMPRMDGLSFLKKVMAHNPIPTVIISSFAPKDSHLAIRAYELGAIDVLLKPDLSKPENVEASRQKICDAVRTASMAKMIRRQMPQETAVEPKLTADAVIPKNLTRSPAGKTEHVIIAGASTGGTDALRIFLEAMDEHCPGIVIVQHMPELFTRSFAERLNQLCGIEVKEAENGDHVMQGRALIAPGNKHMILKKTGNQYVVNILDGPHVNRHKPSVDVLFRSAAQVVGRNAIGVLMTGMGNDGAEGLLELKESGAFTIAQDEKSCIVFGMPKEAIKLNAAQKILALEQIAPFIMANFK